MRILLGGEGSPAPGTVLDEPALERLYAVPAGRSWLRVNFVSSLDGAVTGADGRSGSINTPADHRVFRLLRRLSDVVVVGAGTVRAEGYPARPETPICVCHQWRWRIASMRGTDRAGAMVKRNPIAIDANARPPGFRAHL